MPVTDELLLNEKGWTLECEGPLEIRNNETGTLVTGHAATGLIAVFRKAARKHPADWENLSSYAELLGLCNLVNLLHNAASKSDLPDAWKHAHDLMFHPKLSGRITEKLKEHLLPLNYQEPNATYQEKVGAYVSALKELQSEISERRAKIVLLGHFTA